MSSDDRGPLVLTPDMIQERVRLVEVADLSHWDGPYQGDVGAAHTLMGTFGQFQLPVVVDGEVIYGQEFVAAEQTGEQFGGRVAVLDVTDLDWPREKVLAAVLGLDRLHALAQVDAAQLLDQLQEIRKADEVWLAGAGYDDADLEAIYEQLQRDQEALDAGAGHAEGDDADKLDEVPESAPARTKPGDVWLLGSHRIMCGDCRDPEHVAALLDGATINLAFTSPPYASQRKYDEASGFKPIHPDEYVDWFEPVQACVANHLADDGSWFVNIKPAAEGLDTQLYVFDLVLAHARRWGWHYATEFCWERPGTPGKPVRRFKAQFEPVYHFAHGEWRFRPESVMHGSDQAIFASRGRGRGTLSSQQGIAAHDAFDGMRSEGDAYPGNRLPTFAGSHEALGHTAAFPVGLPAWFCRAYTDSGDVVYDPFMGSGSTLIAAHSEGRIGYGTEISPKYVDLICARWQRLTGEKPVLASTGEAHDFVDG